jgi:hypothetical protein
MNYEVLARSSELIGNNGFEFNFWQVADFTAMNIAAELFLEVTWWYIFGTSKQSINTALTFLCLVYCSCFGAWRGCYEKFVVKMVQRCCMVSSIHYLL